MTLLTAFLNAPDTSLVQAVHEDDNWIMHHISDKPVIPLPAIHLGGVTIDLSISSKILMLIISALLMILIFGTAAAANRKRKHPKGLGNFIEMMMVFVRDDIVLPSLGKDGGRFLPFFFTLFFFILFINFLGLIPGM